MSAFLSGEAAGRAPWGTRYRPPRTTGRTCTTPPQDTRETSPDRGWGQNNPIFPQPSHTVPPHGSKVGPKQLGGVGPKLPGENNHHPGG